MTPVRVLCLLWVIALGFSCFFIRPVGGAAATMWILVATPVLGIIIKKEDLVPYAICFGVVAAIFSFGLVLQEILDIHYTYIDARRKAWPLLDPNNAAAVVSVGLIASLYFIRHNAKFIWATILFCAALYVTYSRAGIIGTVSGVIVLLARSLGLRRTLILSLLLVIFCESILYLDQSIIVDAHESFITRYPIWQASLRLLGVNPFIGLGLGKFGYYYNQIRTEWFSAGAFAHNDTLQIAIEMGVPAAAIFLSMLVLSFVNCFKYCTVSASIIVCIFMMSSVEFQFYTPVISMLMGLAMAAHEQPKKRYR